MGALSCDRKHAEKLLAENGGSLRRVVAHSGPVVSNTVLAIDAGTLLTPHVEHSPARIIVENGLIAEVGPADRIAAPPTATRIDAAT